MLSGDRSWRGVLDFRENGLRAFSGKRSVSLDAPFLRAAKDGIEPRFPCSEVPSDYARFVIKSFVDKATAALFFGRRVHRLPPDIHRRAYAKLQALDSADTLDFLRVPPSNRLERLRSDRGGRWSIRINDQWRICLRITSAPNPIGGSAAFGH